MTDSSGASVESQVHCPECDYSLEGAVSERCPWCGWVIDADVLIAVAASPNNPGRFVVIVVAMLIAGGTLVAASVLATAARGISFFDKLAIAGALIAGTSLVGLALLAFVRRREPWPMRRGDLSSIIRLTAWLSIALAIIGATPAYQFAPTKLIVQGTTVNGPFEFFLTCLLFTFPGWSLLLLYVVSFRNRYSFRTTDTVMKSIDDGASFLVETRQTYCEDQVSQTWRDEPRKTTPSIEAAIARTWETETALAAESSRTLYNGQLVRLIELNARDESVHLVVGPTDYRDFLGTNLHHAQSTIAFGMDHLSHALGVSAVVITRDGFLMFGRRSDRVASHAGYLHAFGGMVEMSDRRPDGSVDLFGCMRRELEEETAISPGDLTSLTLCGVVRDRLSLQPELLFEAVVKMSHRELASRFDPSLSHHEHDRLVHVRDEPDAIIAFLTNAPLVAPVAQAAMLLRGRRLWGLEWYEQVCHILYGSMPPAQRP